MNSTFCFVFTIVCILAISADDPSTDVAEGEYPFVVSILHERADGHKLLACAGTIVGAQWILTHSLCVEERESFKIFVQFGSGTNYSKTDPNIKTIKGGTVFVPDNSTPKRSIALFKLSTPIPVESFKPPQLPNADKPAQDEIKAMLVGWGVHPGKNSTTGYLSLSKVPVNIEKPNFCHKIITEHKIPFPHTEEEILCATGTEGPGSASRNGDAGGPVLINNVVWGVVYQGASNINNTAVDFYFNVGYYRDWINNTIKNNS